MKSGYSKVAAISMLLLAGGGQMTKADDNTPKRIRYWFDTDPTVQSVQYKSSARQIDASSLSQGVHMLHCQVEDGNGALSPTQSWAFLKAKAEGMAELTSLRYWFDDDAAVHTVAYGPQQSIDVQSLDEGIHLLHYQVADAQGDFSPTRSALFLKVAGQAAEAEAKTIYYWFDDQETVRQMAYGSGVLSLDASALDEGMHSVNVQVVDSWGRYTPVTSCMFYKAEQAQEDDEPQTIRYWLAGRDEEVHTVPYQTQLIQQHDFGYLPEGDYVLCYQVVTKLGALSPVAGLPFKRACFDAYIDDYMHLTTHNVDSVTSLSALPSLRLCYKMDDAEALGQLEVDRGLSLSLDRYQQDVHLGYYAENNVEDGPYYGHMPTLLNQGTMQANEVQVAMSAFRDRWHFISLPFDVNLSEVATPAETYWALRSYDGAARAAGNMRQTWVNLNSRSQLEAGRGYILQLTKDGNYYDDTSSQFLFHAVDNGRKNGLFASGDVTTALNAYDAEFAHNRSWNLIGNPYPSFFDTRYLSLSSPITVWTGTTYKAVTPGDDDYVLTPFEAFFIQRPEGAEAITFSQEGRQSKSSSRRGIEHAPAADMAHRQVYNLALSLGEAVGDECRIVLNEEALTTYEPACDAAKFLSDLASAPQLYSERDGVEYAINERPLADGLVSLTLRLPQSAEYTLALASSRNAQQPVYLYDQQTHQAVSLDDAPYTFTAREGTLASRMILTFGEVMGLDQISENQHGRIEVFDLDGKRCYRGRKALSELGLTPGLYVVRTRETSYKIIIK